MVKQPEKIGKFIPLNGVAKKVLTWDTTAILHAVFFRIKTVRIPLTSSVYEFFALLRLVVKMPFSEKSRAYARFW